MNNSLTLEDDAGNTSIDLKSINYDHMGQETIVDATSETTSTASDEASSPSFFALVRRHASVSDALRLFGALAVATAMALFMLEGVEVNNDLYRFLTMLGLTTALTAAGLLMSKLLKEQRGSRLFIGLGLLSIPVNFTVFGALIYSIIPLDIAFVNYPSFAHWTVTNARQVPLALAAGVMVLLPTVWLGFTILARSERKWLSAAIILSGAFMLIPVRQELWSAIIAISCAAIIGYLVHKNRNNSLALKTPEGRFSIALLFVAPVIIAVRSLFLYETTGILIVTLSAGFYLCARHLLSQRIAKGFITALLTSIATFAALIASISIASLITHHVFHDWYVIVGTVVLLFLTLDMTKIAAQRKLPNKASIILVFFATAALMLETLFTNQPAITAVSAMILLIVSAYGYLYNQLTIGGIAMIGVISIFAYNVTTLWHMALQTGWWGIGAIGAIAIILGSMLDRAGTLIEVKH